MSKKKVDKFLGGNESLPITITVDYTEFYAMEMEKCMNDIMYFAENYFYIVNLDEGRQTIKLFDAQRKAIQQIIDNKRTIVCASRQIGKSTLMTIVCLWNVLFKKDYQVAILANKEDQAKEILERIKLAYEEIPNWLKSGVLEFTKEVLLLVNKSKIFVSTTSESGIRGKSVNLLFVDEFAHIAPQIADPFFKSVMPTISSSKSAKIVLISTPKGAAGKFYEIFRDAEKSVADRKNNDTKSKKKSNWTPVRIHYSEVPGRDEEWVKEQLASINYDMDAWRQEFEIEFLESGTAALNQGIIEQLKSLCCPAEFSFDEGTYHIWKKPEVDRIISIGVDVAEGVGQDYTVAIVLDITDPDDIEMCAVFATNKMQPWLFAEKLNQIARSWGRPFLCIESNKEGSQVLDALINVHYYDNIVTYNMKNDKRQAYQKPGIFSHQNSKYTGIQNMKYFIEKKQCVTIYDLLTVREFETFVRKVNRTWGAKKGFNDDRVMALVWALVILEKFLAEEYLDVLEYDEAGKPSRISDPNQALANLSLNGYSKSSKKIRDVNTNSAYNCVMFNPMNHESLKQVPDRYDAMLKESKWEFF